MVLVAASMLLGSRLLAAADDTVTVWAASEPLRPGVVPGRGDLVPADVRFATEREASRYVSAEDALPAGTVLLRTVGAGELVPRAALGTPGPVEPLVEVPVVVTAEALLATVRVGSLVDVWVTPQRAAAGTGDRQPARLVFDDVPVLALPDAATSLGPSSTRQVIVGLGPSEHERLGHAVADLAAGHVLLTRSQD